MSAGHAEPAPARLSARAAALLEQGALSGAHFIAFLLFARDLAPAAWGQFGLAYAMVLFAQGFQRALVTIPMIAFSAAGGWPAQRAAWAGANTSLALAAAALALAGTGLAAAWGPAWLKHSMAMAALMAVPLVVHEFARRAAVQEGRLDLLAGLGLCYAAVLLALALAPVPAGLRAWMPALAVAAAAAAAAGLYRWVSRREALARPGPLPRPPRYGAYAGWASASHLAYSGYNFGIQAVLAAIAGPVAVGALHACRVFVQPVATLQSALDSIDKPRAAAALAIEGPRGMRRALLRTVAWVAVLALPYLAAVAVFAPALLEAAYRDLYAGERWVVSLWCLAALCSVVSQPVESGLYVAKRTRPMFLGRAVAAAVSLAAAVPLVGSFGAAGALAATALGFALAAVFGSVSLMRLERSANSP